jgi:hypothetical protein
MSEPTRYMHSGGTISTVTLPEPTIITTGRAAMTPAELYESVKPLWERDGSFQPDGLRIGPSRTWEAPTHGYADKAVDYLRDDIAAALIRDRIVERCLERGWKVDMGRDGLEIDGLYDGINPDRTLALIEAALKATEKQG